MVARDGAGLAARDAETAGGKLRARLAPRGVGDLGSQELRVLNRAQHQPRAVLHTGIRRWSRGDRSCRALDPDLLLVELQKVLLRPDHAPRTHDPQPRDGFPRSPAVLPHDPRGNQRSSSPQTRQAVHSNHSALVLGDFMEVAHELQRWRRAVIEVQVIVCEVAGGESSAVVRVRFVQAHDTRDP
eukprot:2418127-Rhodomonas_salina.2